MIITAKPDWSVTQNTSIGMRQAKKVHLSEEHRQETNLSGKPRQNSIDQYLSGISEEDLGLLWRLQSSFQFAMWMWNNLKIESLDEFINRIAGRMFARTDLSGVSHLREWVPAVEQDHRGKAYPMKLLQSESDATRRIYSRPHPEAPSGHKIGTVAHRLNVRTPARGQCLVAPLGWGDPRYVRTPITKATQFYIVLRDYRALYIFHTTKWRLVTSCLKIK